MNSDEIHVSVTVGKPEDLLQAPEDFIERVILSTLDDNPAPTFGDDSDK